MTILDSLAGYARERVRQAERRVPLEVLRQEAFSLPRGAFPFERALKRDGIAFICECKKASPSKGVISPEFP